MIQRITQLKGHEIRLDGAWRKIARVTGPHRPQFGARGSYYRVTLADGYTDSSGRIYPDQLHIWRGDSVPTRKVPK